MPSPPNMFPSSVPLKGKTREQHNSHKEGVREITQLQNSLEGQVAKEPHLSVSKELGSSTSKEPCSLVSKGPCSSVLKNLTT